MEERRKFSRKNRKATTDAAVVGASQSPEQISRQELVRNEEAQPTLLRESSQNQSAPSDALVLEDTREAKIEKLRRLQAAKRRAELEDIERQKLEEKARILAADKAVQARVLAEENARRAAERQAMEERRAAEEAQRRAEQERREMREAAAAEKRRIEEEAQRLLAEEQARKAEEQRQAEEQMRRLQEEEEHRKAEEARRAAEELQRKEEERQQREAAEKERKEIEARMEEERRKAEEALRQAEEQRLAEEAAIEQTRRKAEELRAQQELLQREAEDAKKRAEAARQKAEEDAHIAERQAAKAEAARQQALLELQRAQAEKAAHEELRQEEEMLAQERLRKAQQIPDFTPVPLELPLQTSNGYANGKDLIEPLSLSEAEADIQADFWDNLPEIQLNSELLAHNRIITAKREDPAHTAFDVLRTRLLQALSDNGWKRVAITSAGKDCGKTFTAANLAISLSRQSHCRTMLMDCDMRRPSLHRMMGIEPPYSLGEMLRGEIAPEDYFVRLGDNTFGAGEQLAFGLNNTVEPYASELLQDRQTQSILTEIESKFAPDVFLFDLPPTLYFDDVMAFRPYFDGVLLVVGGGVTSAKEIKEVEKRLGTETPLLGVVLNMAEGTNLEHFRY